MGFKTFNDGDVLTDADVNTYLMKQAVIVCTTATRPSSPVEGMTIAETDTDKLLTYSGSAWRVVGYYGDGESYTPTLKGSSTDPTMGSVTSRGRYWRVGSNLVRVWAWIKLGSGFSAGSGSYAITLPVSVNATYNRQSIPFTFYDASATGHYRGFAHAGEDASPATTNLDVGKLLYHNDGAIGFQGITNSAPVVPASGDIYELSGTYYV